MKELESVYTIDTYAVYKGGILLVTRVIEDHQIELYTNDSDLANSYSMNQINKNEFIKAVPKSEVEIYEEKKKLN
ncbi:hypothetical protein [Terribacillus saccharophilus]|uniref:hypothetical protein n=1 Tax=Terribacillus saccharophilus TaxID=361277 RepID=UPI0011403F43|nr:hypothetical protein [Terribacillus saccharophilus]